MIRAELRTARDRVSEASASVAISPVIRRLGVWELERVRVSRSGTIIARLRSPVSGNAAYLKVARRQHGIERLLHEVHALEHIAADIRLARLRALVPRPLDTGAVHGWHFLLEEAMPGTPAPLAHSRWLPSDANLAQASSLSRAFHRPTAVSEAVTSEDVAAWIDRPLDLVRRLLPAGSADLERLRQDVVTALAGSRAARGWVHGDYWWGNILIDRHSGAICGIVDWDSADQQGLALHDQLHLVLYSRKMRKGGAIGAEIALALTPGVTWSAAESEAVAAAVEGLELVSGVRPLRLALILYWLRIVRVNMERQPRMTASSAWVRHNIESVVRSL